MKVDLVHIHYLIDNVLNMINYYDLFLKEIFVDFIIIGKVDVIYMVAQVYLESLNIRFYDFHKNFIIYG